MADRITSKAKEAASNLLAASLVVILDIAAVYRFIGAFRFLFGLLFIADDGSAEDGTDDDAELIEEDERDGYDSHIHRVRCWRNDCCRNEKYQVRVLTPL